MKKNRLLALLLVGAFALPATGCEDFEQNLIEWMGYKTNTSEDSLPRTQVTPEEADIYVESASHVFNHAVYTREMFFGKYVADGVTNTEMNTAEKTAFLENAETFMITGTFNRLTAMPYRIELGPHCNVTPLNYLSGYEWATLYYYDVLGNSVQVSASYSVDGNALNFQPIKSYEYDADTGTLSYDFSGDTLRYYYTLNGDGLILSNSQGKVHLYPEKLHRDPPVINIYDANLSPDSKQFDDVESIHLTEDSQYVVVDGTQCEVTGYELSEDGTFRLRWNTPDGESHAVQLAYLYCDDDGIVLLDDLNAYYYNAHSNELYTKKVKTNVSAADSEALQNMTAAELDALQKEVEALYADLQAAFKEAGVDATVDANTGEIALNSGVLFGVDDYFISSEGADALKRFLKAYTSVIFSDKYNGFVSEVIIEGHTDPTGLIYHNEVLSQARADQVKDFCCSADNGLSAEATQKLIPMLSAVGYAASHPIFKADGEVDYEASRRVSFHFMVDLNAGIQ